MKAKEHSRQVRVSCGEVVEKCKAGSGYKNFPGFERLTEQQ